MDVGSFTCSICGEASRDICTFCTKDTCANHLCERCRRCSDCCECDVQRVEDTLNVTAVPIRAPISVNGKAESADEHLLT